MGVIQIRNRADRGDLEANAVPGENGKFSGLLLVKPYRKILLGTEPIYSSGEEAIAFIQTVITAACAYMIGRESEREAKVFL